MKGRGHALVAGAALLCLALAAFQVWYVALPDERAARLDVCRWSRHLDWSYYSKGPLVAYLIRLGCDLFGSWSEGLVGSQMVAVRLPAVACGSLLLLSLYVLTAQTYRREFLGLALVAGALTVPVLSAAPAGQLVPSVISTPARSHSSSRNCIAARGSRCASCA